ncbi:MAG TPA: R3H domain-containing nucleic acid-binding protein [Chloroflexota bacterium]|nr:R3H domain-containing nucleic acid-binding protein [Chloroflexota bacterium]
MAYTGSRSGERVVVDDLHALLAGIPPHIREPLDRHALTPDLLEVILDLGREPEARFPGREVIVSDRPVTQDDLDYVIQRIGAFGDDNRAGIERTLHRISAIRNRSGRIVGLTLRVGRAVFGTVAIIQDIVESRRSILLLGRPGVGKTTMLRETARVLADDLKQRVVIVDTSNEIAGDGDIPHPAIGRARRMQVPTPSMQHQIMIEAVENHMPEVIVIDEIGNELEAAAARTIAERGVQLVATAHGNTLENLIMNPTLSDLIGGIQTVTLGDEEARRRGTQKSVLERKAPPTFDVLVEIQERERVAVHENIADVVDSLLRGDPVAPIIRFRDEHGRIRTEQGVPPPFSLVPSIDRDRGAARGWGGRGARRGTDYWQIDDGRAGYAKEYRSRPSREEPSIRAPEPAAERTPAAEAAPLRQKPLRIFPFGVNRSRLEQAVHEIQAPVVLSNDVNQADVVITVKNYYRRKPQPLRDAEASGVPVYVLRSNTGAQILEGMEKLMHSTSPHRTTDALQEAEDAVHDVLNQDQPAVELAPQNAYIRRLQHQIADRYNLASRSTGREPHRRVMIYQPEAP